MIKLQASNRATVTESFKELLTKVAREQVSEVKESCERYPSKRAITLQIATPKLRTANSVLKDMDGITTKLRLLNGYTLIETYRYGTLTYFHAHTKTVTLSDGRTDFIPGIGRFEPGVNVDHKPIWNMGEYDVYFPEDIFSHRNLNHFQFVPEMAPLDGMRHPHHHAKYLYGGESNGDLFFRDDGTPYYDPETPHPLAMTAKTCWGGFNSVIASNLNEMDIVELFRTIWIFLTRHNAGSPLIHLDNIEWKVAL